MDGDAYRDMSHYEMQQFIWRKVAAFADYANIEQRLSNEKIADVFYQCGMTTVIVEVKTQLKHSLIKNAWNKYSKRCEYLAIACPPQLYYDDDPARTWGWPDECLSCVG